MDKAAIIIALVTASINLATTIIRATEKSKKD
jgi:hypothetical protein